MYTVTISADVVVYLKGLHSREKRTSHSDHENEIVANDILSERTWIVIFELLNVLSCAEQYA